MFGQNDAPYQNGQDQSAPQPANDVPADGTLSEPTDATPMSMPQQQDDNMPGYEPTAVTDDTQSPRGDAHTPEELASIKQEALQSLKPLVGHLQQSAEEKFRTTMMMIQASDDQSLIPEAYEAAKAITDEKMRAQALLDVVNEINYFTSQSQASN